RARASGQHVALPGPCRQGNSLQRREHLAEPVRSGPPGGAGVAPDALPGGVKASKLALLRRFDFLAQRRQGGAAHALEHIRITPLALASTRTELTADQLSLAL